MISIIVPNHNERRIKELMALVYKLFPDAEVILSNDFNSKGKGWAIREGFNKSTGEIVVFLDGDMDIHPCMIFRLLPYIRFFDIVVATKDISEQPFSRKLLTFLSRKFIKVLFRLPVNDTQTGLKMFRRSALREWKCNGFAFDIEILLSAHKRGCDMCEVPIVARTTKRKSCVVILKTLLEAIRVRLA